ncbi:MAG: hypothetical protein IKP88_11690 [Lachnospiraceae bacterium]|nr:hypothetical protein [Lachnospiraceae bacterium]
MGYAMTGHDDGKNGAISTYNTMFQERLISFMQENKFSGDDTADDNDTSGKDRSEEDGENPMGYKRQ